MNDWSEPGEPVEPGAAGRFASVALESLSDPAFAADETGALVWASGNVAAAFGRPATGFVREESVESLVGADLSPARVAGGQTPDKPRMTVTDGSGRERTFRVVIEPCVFDRELYVYVCRDETELVERERTLRESERRFRGLFEGTLDSLVLADDEGTYVDANPAACDLFGLPREELVGRSIADFAAGGFDFDAAWAAFLAAGEQRGEFPLKRPDGEVRIVDFAAAANIREGEHLSVLRDVTERVRRERLVERQRDDLLRLADFNDLLRRVNRHLVGATERVEILTSVCESFVDADRYDAAAFFSFDPVRVDVAAGTDAEAFERSSSVLDAVRRIRDEQRSVEVDGPPGVGPLFALPVAYDGAVYAAFVVDGSGSGFAAGERTLLEELSQTVGKALASTAAQRLLHAKSVLRVEFEIDDESHLYNRLNAEFGGRVRVDEIVPVANHREVHYVTVGGADAESIVSVAESIDGVVSCRALRDDEETSAEFVVDGGTPVLTLVEQGAHVESLVCERGRCRVVADVAPGTDVRALLSHVRRSFPNTRLVSKRSVSPSATRPPPAVAGLTEKQRLALRAAYTAGYYEWPQRRTTAAELAASFGVAPATFHQHLRVAEAKVLAEYFSRVGAPIATGDA